MIQRTVLVVLLAFLFISAIGFTIDESVIESGVNPVEEFCRRTIRRFNDAWLLSEIEFDRAQYAVSKIPENLRDQATEYIKDAVDKAVSNAVNDTFDKANSDASGKIPDQSAAVPASIEKPVGVRK